MLMTKQYNTNLPTSKQVENKQTTDKPIFRKVVKVSRSVGDSDKVKLLLKNF